MGAGGFSGLKDMIDGGGAGMAGDTFKGGAMSDIANAIGIKPMGYMDRMQGMQTPQMRPPMPQPGAMPPQGAMPRSCAAYGAALQWRTARAACADHAAQRNGCAGLSGRAGAELAAGAGVSAALAHAAVLHDA